MKVTKIELNAIYKKLEIQLKRISKIETEIMRLKKRQEYLEDSLLDGEDIKRLKKASEALKKGDVISLEEIKKDLNL